MELWTRLAGIRIGFWHELPGCIMATRYGWYALNVKTKRVTGPVQESELSANKEWSQIKRCAPELIKGSR